MIIFTLCNLIGVLLIGYKSFAYYNFVKYFYAKLITLPISLLLAKCILLESRVLDPCWLSPTEYLLYSRCCRYVDAGEPQQEPVFGYFYPVDGGVDES